MFTSLLDRLCFSRDYSYNTFNNCESGQENTTFSISLSKQMQCGSAHSMSLRRIGTDNVPNHDHELTSKSANVKYKYKSFPQQLSLISDAGMNQHFSTTMEKQTKPSQSHTSSCISAVHCAPISFSVKQLSLCTQSCCVSVLVSFLILRLLTELNGYMFLFCLIE